MSAGEMQACLARLYVSDCFRLLARQSPQLAFAAYDLSKEESAAIESLDREMLEEFAGSLKTKRKRRFEHAFPASFALHGTALDPVWERFLELSAGRPLPSVHHEALEFGRFAEQSLADERFPCYSTDLMRYERLTYEITFISPPVTTGAPRFGAAGPATATDIPVPLPGVLHQAFQYDVSDLEVAIREGRTPPQPVTDPHVVVFRSRTPTDDQRMFRINDATAAILDRCDGSRTVSEIVDDVERQLAAVNLFDPIVEAIGRLQVLRVLSLLSGPQSGG